MRSTRNPPRFALTLWPEWAWAFSHLGKDIENRSWGPSSLRPGDWLAIHAGAHIGGRPGMPAALAGLQRLRDTAETAGWRVQGHCLQPAPAAMVFRGGTVVHSVSVETMPTRCIVALAQFAEVWTGSASSWAVPGSMHWVFRRVHRLSDPVPVERGRQGLWRTDAYLEQLMPHWAVAAASSIPRSHR